jgi:hypothetical protein
MKAKDIVWFCGTPKMLEKLGRINTISLATAWWWLHKMGYHWVKNLRGQYVDGHKQPDVVAYQQQQFIPAMIEYRMCMQQWIEEEGWSIPPEVQ